MVFRRRRIFLLALAALALIAFFALRALLQPARVSDFLLQQAEQFSGLRISLDSPADIGLWPDFHIELEGLSARTPDAEQPLLRAERVEVVLPWSALRGDTLQLLGVRLMAPRLDLPATLAFFDSAEDVGPPPPLRLPQIDAPLEIRRGRIDGDGWVLDDIDLTLPSLHEAQPTQLTLGAQWLQDDKPQRFALHLQTTPRSDGPSLHLAPLRLDLALDALPAWRPHLEGELRFSPAGSLDFNLQTHISPWPKDWPALPFPAAPDNSVQLALRYAGDTQFSGLLDLSLQRDEDGLHGQLSLGDTLTWLSNPGTSPLPPLQGQVDITRLEYEGIQARGIRLQFQAETGND